MHLKDYQNWVFGQGLQERAQQVVELEQEPELKLGPKLELVLLDSRQAVEELAELPVTVGKSWETTLVCGCTVEAC